MKKLFLIAALLIIALPLLAYAHQGLGPSVALPIIHPGGGPLALCELWHVAIHLTNFLLFIILLPVLVIMFLWGGILYLTSTGNPSQIEKAKKLFIAALVGTLIAFSAWLIINTIIVTIANGFFSAPWYSITCPAAPPTAGPTTPTTPTTPPGLVCSASTVSSAVNSIRNCVLSGAAGQGLAVNSPSPNQLNQGGHACNLNSNPPNISCHYGGTQCNGTGNAVDFSLSGGRNPANWAKLQQLAVSCGASSAFCEAGGTRPKDSAGNNICTPSGIDHIHANASASCGCN